MRIFLKTKGAAYRFTVAICNLTEVMLSCHVIMWSTHRFQRRPASCVQPRSDTHQRIFENFVFVRSLSIIYYLLSILSRKISNIVSIVIFLRIDCDFVHLKILSENFEIPI